MSRKCQFSTSCVLTSKPAAPLRPDLKSCAYAGSRKLWWMAMSSLRFDSVRCEAWHLDAIGSDNPEIPVLWFHQSATSHQLRLSIRDSPGGGVRANTCVDYKFSVTRSQTSLPRPASRVRPAGSFVDRQHDVKRCSVRASGGHGQSASVGLDD